MRKKELNCDNSQTNQPGGERLESKDMSRRNFIRSTTRGAMVGTIAGASLSGAAVGSSTNTSATASHFPQGRHILLKDGVVLTMDSKLGDFDKADVLIRGSKIAAVGKNLPASDGVEMIDASNHIIMPGFIDTHHHNYQRVLINQMSNALLSDYVRDIYTDIGVNQFFRAEDAYIGQLLSGLSALNHGITTVVDLSSVEPTIENNDASIKGLHESGVRAVFCHGRQDFERLNKTHFSNNDGLLSLGFNTYLTESDIHFAREAGVPIVSHVVPWFNPEFSNIVVSLGKKGLLGPDITFIHCTELTDAAWKTIADHGVHVSIASPIEMVMRHGMPPIQKALDLGIRPSLSSDVDGTMTQSPFAMMRSIFTLQRMLINQRSLQGEEKLPELLTTRETIELATVNGSKANGLENKIGTLTPGKEADIIMLTTDALNVMPMNNAYGSIVSTMDSSNVDAVFVAGKARKWDGKMLDIDIERVTDLARNSRDYLFSKTRWQRSVLDTSLSGT
ncbi:amidohydrolase family protein [Pseudomaricurvus alkylphenolicus]|uniref:amidohydrolase family protein n=1 Tax=Pseudomaricurvus alkylphenolicus TaxID=1306991 RepID=UPI0014224C28|nr:amidohydrolase family protein [Pseudomaricurvus alkylphenolicus]NIB40821.1 amidohydrolase family protein [Pseudomaricurvus alkylphenolicus]